MDLAKAHVSLLLLLAEFVLTIARECTSDIISPVSQVRYENIVSSYSYGCGFLWLSRCRRTRNRRISLMVYQLQTVGTQTECCNDYTMSSDGTCQPVCSDDCVAPRYCREPNTCTCIDSGYHGDDCTSPVCTSCSLPRVCAAPGVCRCESGLTGPTCEEDINECESLGDSTGCEQICVNTMRSYTCACREGYTLGMDGGRCVGSVNISLSGSARFSNSSSIVAEWSPPVWDTERLTTSYIVSCSNGTFSTNATVLNSTNSGLSQGTFQETFDLFDLDSDSNTEYECCIMVVTLNGNGPPSCTTFFPPTTMPPPTESSESTGSDFTSSASTDPELTNSNALGSSTGSPSLQSILQSSGFKIGIGVGGACVAAIVVAVVVVVACCACFHYRRHIRFKESAISVGFHSKVYRPSLDTANIQRDVDNELYQTNYTKASAKIKSIDEEDDDSGREYNEVTYKGGRAKVNAYEDALQYHYVKY